MLPKKDGKRKAYILLKAIIGTLLFAIGMNIFIVPLGFYSGGFLGFGQIIRTILVRYLGLSISGIDVANIIYYAINLPIFFLAYKAVGRDFFVKSMICLTTQTLFLLFIKSPQLPIIEDSLTGALLGGILAGAGVGLTLQSCASSGGSDMLAMYLIQRGKKITAGQINLVINVIVYGLCALMFDISVVIYSFIYVIIYSIVTDKFHWQNIIVGSMIVTNNLEMLSDIKTKMRRSATIVDAKGAYTDKNVYFIYTVVSKYETEKLMEIINEYDSNAFVSFFDIHQIQGNFESHMNA